MEATRARKVQESNKGRIPRNSQEALNVEYEEAFTKRISKLRHEEIKRQIQSLVQKILERPETGKPMRHDRKGTREVYVQSFRLSYTYDEQTNTIIFLDLYHKDEQ
jgi:mRNA-degrading endonuclease RelE of RelBE toxin-antitoxin system